VCFAWLVIIFIIFVVEQIWIYLIRMYHNKGNDEELIKNINDLVIEFLFISLGRRMIEESPEKIKNSLFQ